MTKIIVYSKGLVHCSVCAPKDMPREEIVAETNSLNPTGIKHQWYISDKAFATGETNPCPCDSEPDSRLHYLMVC